MQPEVAQKTSLETPGWWRFGLGNGTMGTDETEGEDMSYFPENLSLLRRRAGYTQESLAEALNVSRQAVSKWESGVSLR